MRLFEPLLFLLLLLAGNTPAAKLGVRERWVGTLGAGRAEWHIVARSGGLPEELDIFLVGRFSARHPRRRGHFVSLLVTPEDATTMNFHADVRRGETGRLVCTLDGTAPGVQEHIGTIVTGQWTCGETMGT